MTTIKKQTPDYLWLKDYPKGILWDIEIPVEPVYQLLDHSAVTYPNHVALSFFGKHITYKKLLKLVNHAAKGLQQLGVGKGKKVGLFLPNCPHYVIAYYAALKLGATVVNMNPLSALEEIRAQVIDAEVSIVVTLNLKEIFAKAQSLLESTSVKHLVVGALQDFLPFPKNLLFPLMKRKDITPLPQGTAFVAMCKLLANDGVFTPAPIALHEDIALLQYTGGTTGTPKGAVLTHANVYANTLQCQMWFNTMKDGKETLLAVLPFFHCFAMTAILNLGIQKGARIVIHPRFSLKALLKDIAKERVTVLAAVPTIFSAVNNAHISNPDIFRSLKACVSGGAPLPREIKEAFERLTHCPLVEGYGLTEASPVVAVNPFVVDTSAIPTHTGPLAPAGLPLPATIISIRDMQDTSHVMPQGEIGEICISGPQVMQGYYNKPEETAQVLKDGLLRTGDLGFLDKRGYLYIVDRLKEMIIYGGYKVYPRHVEEAIYKHPAIEEVAVIGQPDGHRGEIVVAYLKLKAGQDVTKEALREFLSNYLSAYEIPKEIHFTEGLPKTLIGKICKKELKQT